MAVSVLVALLHSPLLLTVLVVVLPLLSLLVTVLVSTKNKNKKPSPERSVGRRLPPSPLGLPLLGHLPFLGTLPHRALRSLAAVHGPVMLLRLGRVPTVVASSAAAAEEAMKTRDLAFASRPKLLMAERLFYGIRDMVFAPTGEYWRQARRICVLHLLNPRRILSFRRVREQEVAALVDRVRRAGARAPGSVVNLSDPLITYSNAIISRATFGDRDYGLDGDNGGGKLRKVFAEFEELLGTVPMGEMVPWLWWVDILTGLERKTRRTFEEIDRLLERVIADHRQRRRGGRRTRDGEDGEDDHRDFVDVLLDVNEMDEEAGIQLDTVGIKAIILDMLGAATDASYTVLEWAMAELINHPHKMRNLQDEIRAVAGVGGRVTEDHLHELRYLKAVIKETLRLHSPSPLLLPRETLEDTELLGYYIPAGTRVLIHAWAIGRDPATWERAEEFVPERFLEDAVEYHKVGQDFRFVPFGAGRRGCPGVGFSVPSNELALASLMYHFDWEPPGGRKTGAPPLDMSEVHGLSVRLKAALLLVAKPWSR